MAPDKFTNKSTLVTQSSALLSSRSEMKGQLTGQVHWPLLAISVAGAVGSTLFGMYWLTEIFLFSTLAIGVITAIRLGRNKAKIHERLMSPPPELNNLKLKLSSLALTPSVSLLAKNAGAQLLQLELGMKQVSESLGLKLDPSELTYSRFQASFENGAGAIFAELQDATNFIDQAAVSAQGNADSIKADAQRCLEENAKLLESFSQALQAVNKMETHSSRPELPTAIHDLEQIAKRAKNISTSKGE